jgi:hypothetical protein
MKKGGKYESLKVRDCGVICNNRRGHFETMGKRVLKEMEEFKEKEIEMVRLND